MPMPPKPKPIALRVELEEVSPLIWRRLVVSDLWTLASLHHYLQWGGRIHILTSSESVNA
jgi:Plasmid pRiA4b ORF-3-like protein